MDEVLQGVEKEGIRMAARPALPSPPLAHQPWRLLSAEPSVGTAAFQAPQPRPAAARPHAGAGWEEGQTAAEPPPGELTLARGHRSRGG